FLRSHLVDHAQLADIAEARRPGARLETADLGGRHHHPRRHLLKRQILLQTEIAKAGTEQPTLDGPAELTTPQGRARLTRHSSISRLMRCPPTPRARGEEGRGGGVVGGPSPRLSPIQP